jgi:hypothetical protein
MKSPNDDYFLVIIANGELQFDERITNLRNLHPQLITFIIHIGNIEKRYQETLVKIGFDGKFFFKDITSIRGLLSIFKKSIFGSKKSSNDVLNYLSSVTGSEDEGLQKQKSEENKRKGLVIVLDSGLDFLRDFIESSLADVSKKYEIMSLDNAIKKDFSCTSVLLLVNLAISMNSTKVQNYHDVLEYYGKFSV